MGKYVSMKNNDSQNILEHPKNRLASKDLPKSIRLPLDTHKK